MLLDEPRHIVGNSHDDQGGVQGMVGEVFYRVRKKPLNLLPIEPVEFINDHHHTFRFADRFQDSPEIFRPHFVVDGIRQCIHRDFFVRPKTGGLLLLDNFDLRKGIAPHLGKCVFIVTVHLDDIGAFIFQQLFEDVCERGFADPCSPKMIACWPRV